MQLVKTKYNSQRLPFKPPFFYGWVMVFMSALTLFFSGPGQTYSVSVFIDSYINDFGWSRSLVSSMYSVGTLLAGLAMTTIGMLFDKKGHRFMTTLIVLLFGVACLWMSLVNSIFMLFMGFFFIRLLGQGSMSLSSATMVPQWFIRKRARAQSFSSLGDAVSAAALPVFNAWLILNFGWRFGWRVWAVLLWVVMATASFLVIRNRPEDVGLLPDNELHGPQVPIKRASEFDEVSWTAKEAMRTRVFWLLLFCVLVPSAVGTGLIFHMVSIMSERGLSLEIAALVLSTTALIRLPMVLLAGQIIDRIPVRYAMAFSLGGMVVTMLILLNVSTVFMALTFGVIQGVLGAFTGISGNVIWPNYFGRRHLGSIRGIVMMAMVVGSAFGPLPFGVAYDHFGGYTQIIVASMVFPALGMVAALLSPPPVK